MCGLKDELTAEPTPASEPLGAQYDILRTIGEGSYAQVKLANHRLTGTAVAIKVLLKEKIHYYLISTEVEIMKRMNHPNIVSLHQIIETEKNVFLILELADGHELLNWIKQSGFLPEGLARKIFRQIVHAMCYCHDICVVHRDLKPDNIMVDSTGKVKIVDFGLGAFVKPGKKLSRFCGALQFSAPEFFLAEPYDGTKVDAWNLGIILYFMVTGALPFEGATYKALERQVLLGRYAIPRHCHLSKELREIIRLLLTVDPSERPALKDIMAHPWLKKEEPSSSSHSDKMDPSHLDPEIMTVMADMGFDPREVQKSFTDKLYNEPMATYSLLQCQARQQDDYTSQPEPVKPGVTPFPTLTDPTTFPCYQKRMTNPPAIRVFLSLSSKTDPSENKEQARQRLRRTATEPVMLSHCPQKRMITSYEDSVSTGTQRNLSVNSIRGAYRSWKKWTRRIGESLLQLCCCCVPRRKRRVVPQREA
ncbi:sperm motility kinase 1-like [Arvicanthis niloticus]|uniref:sperm motility kinase 1-like n=1 Tax=Arvicanthis niloticus TaxID=61156 RepID=UPI0014872577|nr:sperm motility kinase Z-like [Arvicanthis niloticus]